jgi:stage V sporulation protein G
MEISEVRVKLVANKDDRLKAFCSMTIDNCFVVRDIKIIDGAAGLFVAMPSRKMSDHCECGSKNYLRAKFCNNCGKKLTDERAATGSRGRLKLHADIAHPINAECRDMIQDRIISAYNEELESSQQPGYVPTDLDTE